jgi:hypothetical protein
MVPKDKLDLDFELAETIYLTVLGFLNTSIQSDYISIAWGFYYRKRLHLTSTECANRIFYSRICESLSIAWRLPATRQERAVHEGCRLSFDFGVAFSAFCC